MRIVLSGAERGTSRRLLLAQKVERLGVNLSQLSVPKKKEFVIPEVFEGAEVWLYTSDDDEDVHRFDTFVREHHDDLHTVIGRPDYDGKWMGEKYVPLWNDGKDLERLAFLCEKNPRVAVSDRALNKTVIDRIRQLHQRWNTEFTVLSSKVEWLEAFDWDNIIVVHWTSVMKYGETQLWDGHGLRRYSAKQKQSARAKHRADIQRLGVDPEAVIEDDSGAVITLAIRSWLEWEIATNTPAYHPRPGTSDEDEFSSDETGLATITPISDSVGSADAPSPSLAMEVAQSRHEGERKLLPILDLDVHTPHQSNDDESLDGEGSSPRQVSVGVARSGQTLRQCNSCYLSSRCPEMRADTECAYEFPVKLQSMDQLKRMCQVILEMQVERAMFGAFAEQLEGQGADPTVSKEFDRVFSMVEKLRDLNDDRDVFSLKVEARSGAGVIDRIFGANVTDKMTELPTPVDTNSVVEQLGVIVDAEVVEPE